MRPGVVGDRQEERDASALRDGGAQLLERDGNAHARSSIPSAVPMPPLRFGRPVVGSAAGIHSPAVPERLPIDPLLPDVVAALTRTNRVVLRAAPGAGKTTRVPAALLDAGLAGAKRSS